ncbi:glycoside hydrolase family 49 protein [Saccharata proteae CBS 121410]|uniref:Glycoside hydrolase family 49 protein n=1 Tax=Saccharata proteae CBS 121410 TaxID=1314787 RepID=A0A9P4HW48_9PEZI|nr:glycoside hydrolase family 49 protein [Saccharata proteae CBS 121410]
MTKVVPSSPAETSHALYRSSHLPGRTSRDPKRAETWTLDWHFTPRSPIASLYQSNNTDNSKPPPAPIARPPSANNTANSDQLKTWWHDTGEINWKTPVQPGNVRQSHVYYVQVSTQDDLLDGNYYDSFVYETIPRNGNGNIKVPGDPSSNCSDYDGITIEDTVNITMAWTQFLYSSDVVVRVQRPFNAASDGNVTIRPTTLNYPVTELEGDIYITVPFSEHGTRFSVEFGDDLYTYRDNCDGPDCQYVQSEDPTASHYWGNITDYNAVMGVEPRNALLIFASAIPNDDQVPDMNTTSTLHVSQGLVTGLDKINASTVVFNPGVYWFTGTAHAELSSSVNWVYIAPGAYVKGAIQFNTGDDVMKATGHGVLSGEQYVYQANTNARYENIKSNSESLRMWTGNSWATKHQTFLISGPTTNAPPFNSMDFTGDLDTISVQASDYKQVGAFFTQTDGMEIYPGSSVRDVFYHSGDDTIKTYYSDVDVRRVVVWKTHTAPVVQFGWASRNLSNITVDDVSVVHSRYVANSSHPSLIGMNQVYPDAETRTDTAVLKNTVTDVTFSNLRSEGIGGNLMRICPLATFRNVRIVNVSLDGFSARTNGIGVGEVAAWTDAEGEPVELENFSVTNYYVGGEKVSMSDGNWGVNGTGRLNVAGQYLKEGGFTVV